MALIIGGYPRSGTTLLRNLCDSHPEITVTMEFGNFAGLGKSCRGYRRQVLKKWWKDRNRSFLVHRSENQWRLVFQSYAFVARYLLKVNRYRQGCIDIKTIEAALLRCFPTTRIVGDKLPYYVFMLDKLAEIDGLVRLIIYRDCRDVTSSALKMVRTRWRTKPFAKNLDTAEKVANQWVRAIELMECHADKLQIIRYEDLVQRPGRELEALGEWLGVNPTGFQEEIIQNTSVGRYKYGLSDEELATVMSIAGPTMVRLGYL